MADADLSRGLNAENPWPGLMPFTEATQTFFHGRDAEAAELLRRVRRERLTILFGQSGLGKTSLLCAGLFPQLRAADFLPVYIRLDWTTAQITPVAQIKQALAENLAQHGVEGRPPRPDETLWGYFHDKETEFWSCRNRLMAPVLVLDQFEEIFTLGQGAASAETLDELAALIENRPQESLRRALDDDPKAATRYDFSKESCRVILALREDFLPDFEGLRRQMPSIMENRMRLTRMDGRQARDAILASGGHLMAPGVAEQVIAFVAAGRGRSEGGTIGETELAGLEIEPALLSIVCSELNNKRICLGQAQITADLLEGAQQEIVGQFYELSLAGIDPALRLFIEEQLLTSEGYRDSRPLAEALRESGVTRGDIDRLVARRLLRIEERFATQWVELTHDLLTEVIRQRRDLRWEQTDAAREAEQRAQSERERAERAEAEAARERVEREVQQKLASESAERERLAHLAIRRTQIWLVATAAVLLIALSAMGLAVYEGRLANARAEEAARSYALALKAAGDNVKIVDSHYKKGAIGTEVAKSLLDAAGATFAKLPSERESVETIRSRIKLFSTLAETYRTAGDLSAALDAAQTEEKLAKPVAEQGPDGARDLADSHSQIGAALQGRGDLAGARTQYESVLAILEPAAAKNPGSTDLQHDLATGHDHLGGVLQQQGDLAGSLSNYKADLAIMEQLAGKDPGNALWQNDLAATHADIGAALEDQGDLASAIGEFQAGLALRMRLVTADPTNAQWRQDLVLSRREVSDALREQGDLAGAQSQAQAGLTLASQLAARDPTNGALQAELASGHVSLGTGLQLQGDLAGALTEFQAALDISRALATKDPSNASWQRALAGDHVMIGVVLQAQGDLSDAQKEFQQAFGITQELAQKDPVNAGWKLDLALVHLKIGDCLKEEGDLASAVTEYQAILTSMNELTGKDPSNASWQHLLAVAHNHVGVTLQMQGDLTLALAESRAQMTILTQLAARDIANASWQRELAFSNLNIGDMLGKRGDSAGAAANIQAAISIAKRLTEKAPSNTDWWSVLAYAHKMLGEVRMRQQDFLGALTELRAALETATELAAKDPANSDWQLQLGWGHNDVGMALANGGNVSGALTEFRVALDILRRLTGKDPSNATWQREVAGVHINNGRFLSIQGDKDGALREFRTAAEILSTLTTKDPTNSRWQDDLANSHLAIGGMLEGQDDLGGAAREYREELAIRARLAAKDPGNVDWQHSLAVSHNRTRRDNGDAGRPLGRARRIPRRIGGGRGAGEEGRNKSLLATGARCLSRPYRRCPEEAT